jgi:hypothetical protein
MGRGEAQLLTDLGRFDAQMLAHQEHLAGARGELAQALFQRGQELLVLERLLGPVPRRLAPVAGGVEQGVQVLERRVGLERLFAARLADRVDDLVLEDAGQPGADLRAAGEGLLRGERGEERFLDRVLGGLAVAKLQRGVAQQVGPLRLDLAVQ